MSYTKPLPARDWQQDAWHILMLILQSGEHYPILKTFSCSKVMPGTSTVAKFLKNSA